MTRLSDVDLTAKLSKKVATKRLDAALLRLLHLRLTLGGQVGEHRIGPPLCVVFEGWDASGKGGAIKRLVRPLDPRHVRVAQFGAPTPDEKRHHFLWRFWKVLPGWGGMAVLDRSWYGRVLVERVEGFATKEQWSRAFGEIVEFEQTLPVAPWHVVAGDDKRLARVTVVETVCEAVEAALTERGYDLGAG
jgi:polyphosphate kinase 2 (PPK2 family)